VLFGILEVLKILKRLRVSEKVKEYNQDFIGFSETKAENVPIRWLSDISGRKNFIWHSVPAVDLSGGMVLGVNEDVYDILEFGEGEFHIRMLIQEKDRKCQGLFGIWFLFMVLRIVKIKRDL
jgi:hypothetical protein